jgi:hypothetical protein
MKYLITESQIDSVVFKYLDTQNFYHREDGGGHYLFESERSYKDNQYPTIAYYDMSEDCFISSDILTEVAEFFSLSLTRSLMIIAKWVEGKIGIEIKYPYSDYGAG